MTVPGEFDAYIEHFNAAKAAWIKLYVALQDLFVKAQQLQRNPELLGQPAFGALPTQQQLREMLTDAQTKSAPLMAEFNRLSQEVRQYAPQPNTASQKG